MTLTITSPTNPRVKRVVKLRKPKERRAAGLLLAEGKREVTRAVAAGLGVVELWVCAELLGVADDDIPPFVAGLLEGGRDGCDVPVIETVPAVFTKLTYHDAPEGVLAVVEQPGTMLDDLPETSAETLVLVGVGTAKPGNLGAMVRTADAAGCAYVLAPHGDSLEGQTSGGVELFNPNAIRASTGAIFTMPTVACSDEEAVAFLRSRGIRILATTPDGGVPHTEADLTGSCAIVIGPEDTGLSEAWLDAADARVVIPMQSRTADSLNASVAAAVLLFEAVRQRG